MSELVNGTIYLIGNNLDVIEKGRVFDYANEAAAAQQTSSNCLCAFYLMALLL